MASNAIGDIDGLLQGSDIADSDEDSGEKFEDRILQPVRLDSESIDDARRALEEANIR